MGEIPLDKYSLVRNGSEGVLMKILLAEDDRTIAEGLQYSLEAEGYEVVLCGSVREGREALAQEPVSLCLLDLGLPDGSGFELCRAAKAHGGVPMIFLTACDDETSVVMGLDMGADDYIAKPFRLRELLSRVRSVLRRSGRLSDGKSQIVLGNVRVDTLAAKVTKDGRDVFLTALEYRLLLAMLASPGKVLSRSQLLAGIWDVAEDFVNDNTLTVYIKRLREKLEDNPQAPFLIRTVRGLGYTIPADLFGEPEE